VVGVNDGITSKDSLVIAGGDINVTAVDDGVRGKDHLVICDGSLTVDAGGDALKSDNEGKDDDPDAVVGVIWIEGGTIDLTAGSDAADAADAARQVTINGGDLNIAAGDDGLHSDGVMRIDGGTIDIAQGVEGIEGVYMYLSGGDVLVVSSDDGINVSGGEVDTVATTDSMDTADDSAAPQGGDRGGDGPSAGGGQGAAGGHQFAEASVATDLSSVTISALEDGGFGGPAEGDNGDRYLEVSGGTFALDTESDGVDVNGSMTMTGGTIVVTATSDTSQGAIDVDDTFLLSGGTLAANGAAAMTVGPESSGDQGSLGIIFSEALPADTVITISDSSGSTVASFTTSKVSQSLVFSSEYVLVGDDYAVTIGGDASGTTIGALIVDATATGGDQIGTITAI